MNFAVLADHLLKLKESEKKDKCRDFVRELKKTVEHESNIYTNHNWFSWYSHQRIIKETVVLGNNRTRGDHANYDIIEIGQNTEKSSGDLSRLTVTQTPGKGYQLTLMKKKTLKE